MINVVNNVNITVSAIDIPTTHLSYRLKGCAADERQEII